MNSSEPNPMVRDGKKLPLAGPFPLVLLQFIFYLLVLVPLWLVVLLPLTLLCQAVFYVKNLFTPKKQQTRSAAAGAACSAPDAIQVLKNASDGTGRKFDVILFGSTGFTGKMAAKYLAKQYGLNSRDGTVKWAIAGRRRNGLEQLRAELIELYGRGNNSGSDADELLPLVLADSGDLQSLQRMAALTKVVATTAGPFDKYGSLLVQSCAQSGTHYCDITGETDWVRRMIDCYDPVARKSGARIVHFCGHDCVPWDLLVLACAQQLQLKKPGDRLTSIRFYDEINSAPSGGTLATVFHSLGSRLKYKSVLGFDPLLKMKEAATTTTTAPMQSGNKLSTKLQSSLGYSKEYKHWVGPFVMAMVMANCVRRSNVLNDYSSKLVYREAVVFPSFIAGAIYMLNMLLLGTIIFCPPVAWLCLAVGLLPQPGQGPSEADMDAGFLKITAFGSGAAAAGADVVATMYFPTDPGYRDTARMLVESSLCLALPHCEARIEVGGGVWTPAACQGEVLTERLLSTGCSMQVQ